MSQSRIHLHIAYKPLQKIDLREMAQLPIQEAMSSQPTRRGHGEDGFTLIEILVTMIIIAILLSIASVLFLKKRDEARASKAKQHAVITRQAIEGCASSSEGHSYDMCKKAQEIVDEETSLGAIVDEVAPTSETDPIKHVLTPASKPAPCLPLRGPGHVCVVFNKDDTYAVVSIPDGKRGPYFVLDQRDGSEGRWCAPYNSPGCHEGTW